MNVDALPEPLKRPLRPAYRKIRTLLRRRRRRSDTWWDNRDRGMLAEEFLRDEVEGVDHPSRRYLREWLTAHPGLTLLDVPCGPAVEYEGIAAAGVPVQYTGMDASDKMLEVARSRFPEADFRKGDVTALPLEEGSVDVVLCRHILEHLPDFRPAVSEAVRVARKRVFLVLFRAPTHSERRELGYGAWDNRISWDELAAHLESLGVAHSRKVLPYDGPVPPGHEENTVVEIDLEARPT